MTSINKSVLFTKTDVAVEDDNINVYYKQNFAQYEDNLEDLKQRVDESFYQQENALTEFIQHLDKQKDVYLRELDAIEAEYDKIGKATKSVVGRIDECNKKVEEYKQIEKHFETFVKNLKALETELNAKKK